MSGRDSALVSETGMFTNPNAMEPFQIERGIRLRFEISLAGSFNILALAKDVHRTDLG